MLEIEKIAENLFDKIRSRFEGVSIGDENAKATLDPTKARFFNFDYMSDGENYGNLTISLVDDNNLKVYFDKDLDDGMVDDQKKYWYKFLKGLRLFAKRNLLTFDIRDIAKSGLNLKDLKHANKDANITDVDDINMTESKMYGTSRSSYQKMESVRIIARHSKQVDENQRGARARHIQAIYIENHQGERFKLPEGTTLNGARVYARHVKNGGQINDDFGQHISKMIKEMSSLKLFARNMRGRQFEDVETDLMVETAIDHYGKIHRDLFTLRGQRGYESYLALWKPEALTEDEFDIAALKERFVKRVFDDRLMDALPIVQRAYQEKKNRVGEEFESWANGILENMDSDEDENDLDINVKSPFANSADSGASSMDGDSVDQKMEAFLQNHGFMFKIMDGKFWLDSKEEIERAKDVIAAHDPEMEFPDMDVYDYEYGIYGTTTNDREIHDHGVMEQSQDLRLLKRLSGITK
jgi:hypothetical protein